MSLTIKNILATLFCKFFNIHLWKEIVRLKLIDRRSYCRRDMCRLCGIKRMIHTSDIMIHINKVKKIGEKL